MDVDGDEPSWTQLREQLERAEEQIRLADQLDELGRFIRANEGRLHSRRYSVAEILSVAAFGMETVVASADTLEEIADKLQLG